MREFSNNASSGEQDGSITWEKNIVSRASIHGDDDEGAVCLGDNDGSHCNARHGESIGQSNDLRERNG